jgi:DNA-binding CsgD family transcriptional regulator
LDQTIAYKNSKLEFVDFTDNLIQVAGVKSEDEILGKRDIADLPWSIYGEIYEEHDRAALAGKHYGALVPFRGGNREIQGTVLCTRSKCSLENNEDGVFIHVIPLYNASLTNLVSKLAKQDPSEVQSTYFVNKDPTKIHLTEREKECLFYLMRGKTSKFIAKMMVISCRTVEFHIDNLKVKFGCHTKSELISIAIQKGFMPVIPDTVLKNNLNGEIVSML